MPIKETVIVNSRERRSIQCDYIETRNKGPSDPPCQFRALTKDLDLKKGQEACPGEGMVLPTIDPSFGLNLRVLRIV